MQRTSQSCVLACAALLAAATAAGAASPGKLVIEPPTPTCAGFHWEIAGDGDEDATARIEFRRAGAETWRRGMDFMRVGVDGVEFVAGSLFDLAPATRYEARLTLVDPDGVDGKATRTLTFTTRARPTMPEGGRTWHVYPRGHAGRREGPLLGDGDWRKALADPKTSPLKPGDRVAFHAGTYAIRPDLSAVTTRPVAEVSTAPPGRASADGRVWHVYPPKYDGKRLKPEVPLGGWSRPHLLFKDRHGKGPRAGDTILLHAGRYRVNRYDYRDKVFQGPKWGVWRLWGGGQAGRPITIKAAGDGEVILDGAGQYAIFELTGADHLVLDGLTFANAHCAIVAGQEPFGACEGLTVTGCTFRDVAMALYSDAGTGRWHVSGNTHLAVVHAGPWREAFGTVRLGVAGSAGRPIVLAPAGDGEVVFDGNDNYAMFDCTTADHVWFHKLGVRDTECAWLAGYMPFGLAPDGLIVTRCRAEDVRMGVYSDESTGEGWHIADNRFIGRAVGNMSMNQHLSPFGISVCGRGHVIEHNHLEWFQDGIDLGWWDRLTRYQDGDYSASVDVIGNYVFGSGDNSVEADGSYFNGRFLRNAFITCNSPSTQSTPGGPYYFIRNLVYAMRSHGGPFKLPSSLFALHNTFGTNLLLSHGGRDCRFLNNLFVFAPGMAKGEDILMIRYKPPTPNAGSNCNGFHLVPAIMADKPFQMDKKAFATLKAYAEATGLETQSILVGGYRELFVNVPEPARGERYRLEGLDFRLVDGAAAIDAGMPLPNVNDGHNGKAPDLGAIEHGEPMPHYGPRAEE